MSGMNRDLDRYIRRRREGKQYTGPSWFDKVFSSAEREERQHVTPEQEEKLEHLEEEIEHDEEELERLHEKEEEVEGRQEKRVGLYHQLLSFFRQGKEQEPELEEYDAEPEQRDDTEDDFRTLAEIYLKWFERLPLRAKQEFKESTDYREFTEILQRRGVARKR